MKRTTLLALSLVLTQSTVLVGPAHAITCYANAFKKGSFSAQDITLTQAHEICDRRYVEVIRGDVGGDVHKNVSGVHGNVTNAGPLIVARKSGQYGVMCRLESDQKSCPASFPDEAGSCQLMLGLDCNGGHFKVLKMKKQGDHKPAASGDRHEGRGAIPASR